MYEDPGRWRGNKRSTDARARQLPAEFHEGTRWDFLRRHECESAVAARGTRQERAEFAACLLRRTADPRNVMLAIDFLRTKGGSAPGPNDLRLDDLGSGERWDMARALGGAILAGTYCPGPHREVHIPKGPGRGYRTLRIQDVEDRVVQRAIVQIVQPLIDPTFSSTSLGYRPKKGRYHALALAERLAQDQDRWCCLTEDVKDAFEQPPHRRLLDVVRRHLPDAGILALIGAVIENESGRGLRQGGSLSPLLLNVYLDHFLDRPWAKRHPETPLIRVADDVLILCRDPDEALRARESLQEMLRPAGMPLKGTPETAVRDLAGGGRATWLGLDLTRQGDNLIASMTDASWAKLEDHLARTHDRPDAPLRANETILGWLASAGMCFRPDDHLEVHARIATTAHRYAFDEIPSREETRDCWQRAHARWLRIRGRTTGEVAGCGAGGSARRIESPEEAHGPQGVPAPRQSAGWVQGRMPSRDEARVVPPWQEPPDLAASTEGRLTAQRSVREQRPLEDSPGQARPVPPRLRRITRASRSAGRRASPRENARGGPDEVRSRVRGAGTVTEHAIVLESDLRSTAPRGPPWA